MRRTAEGPITPTGRDGGGICGGCGGRIAASTAATALAMAAAAAAQRRQRREGRRRRRRQQRQSTSLGGGGPASNIVRSFKRSLSILKTQLKFYRKSTELLTAVN